MSLLSNQINVFLNRFIRLRMRRRWRMLDGGPVSILSNNCLAGLIYHDLGLRFDSPTINLWIPLPSFITFVENLDEALQADIAEVHAAGRPYPVGQMVVGQDQEEIPLHFMHYHTFREALEKWHSRSTRVDRSRLIIVAADNAPCTDDQLRRFQSLPFPKLLLSHCRHSAEVIGHEVFYFKSMSGKPMNMTDFSGHFGRRFYHRINVPETLFQLLSYHQTTM